MNELQTIQSKIYELQSARHEQMSRRPIGFVVPEDEKTQNTPPHQGGSRLIRPLCCRAHSALRALLYLPFILSMFLAVACEKELTHYPEIVAYHAESKTLDVATSDSIGKFNVKVKTFVAQHPDATQDPLYPEIQKNIKANLLRLSLTIDDEWDGETFIEY